MDFSLTDNNDVITLSDKVFNQKFNTLVVHQVITSYMFNKRKGNAAQKSRSNVAGSNKKPWRQKGTGRARAGSFKSPIWRSGGVTFAAVHMKYHTKVNKKMYLNAFKSILSRLIKDGKLYIFSLFDIYKPKTKMLKKKLNFLKTLNSLIIMDYFSKNLYLASRNLYNIRVCTVKNIFLYDLLKYKNIIFTVKAIKKVEDKLK